ncbi:MAG: hypothetical protein HY908_18310 [Myxococcales bacterium]|nr:hypothetical protein [Myxococcales bacterium]
MIGAANRYRELLTTLLLERELAGGTLAIEQESRWVEELDRCWWALTDEEQQQVEDLLARAAPPMARAVLDATDLVVREGDKTMPRQAA